MGSFAGILHQANLPPLREGRPRAWMHKGPVQGCGLFSGAWNAPWSHRVHAPSCPVSLVWPRAER